MQPLKLEVLFRIHYDILAYYDGMHDEHAKEAWTEEFLALFRRLIQMKL